ncbi:MAG: FAD-dependent oxidoreductase [Planctomycetota bacterium]|jgi:flavin-dependent dehydrogenase
MMKFGRLTLVAALFCLPFLDGGCLKSSKSGVLSTEKAVCAGRESPFASGPYERAVNESARDIPVAYDVDVVVVGGTSGGVAAAVKAAQQGAKVFLAAQRPYLGQDLCGTYRLWLEPGQKPTSPLAKKVFAEPTVGLRLPEGIKFTYEADKPSAGVHKDTATPSVLTDGKFQSASTQSVQYDGDVTITADLGKEHNVRKITVMAYQRRNRNIGNDFEVQSVGIFVSNDKQQFKKVTVINNKIPSKAVDEPWGPVRFSAPVSEGARYVKLFVKKSEDVNRVLLGEIVIEDDQPPATPDDSPRTPPTPMQVKCTLDEALLEAGVQFLYGCYATDVLRDASGNVAGIVMANRSGRQAVKAKVVIDATPRATVARMAGAAFEPYPAGRQIFKRIVVGGEIQGDTGIQARKMPTPVSITNGPSLDAIEYPFKIFMKDGSFASFAEAEQIARDETWHPEQGDASEVLFQIPPDPMKGKKCLSGDWPGAEKVNLNAFRPVATKRLFVLGGCADISRDAAEKLIRPLELMKVGSRIGSAAASEAKRIRRPRNVRLRGKPATSITSGDVREHLTGIRPTQTPPATIPTDSRAVPVLGEVDVVVVGGGTGGAPAGIAAARQGAKTIVIEYLHGLGGVGTLGLISKYYHGYRVGFTSEIDQGLAKLGGSKEGGSGKGQAWNIELKMEWYRQELRKAGADIWFGTLGCGAFMEDGRVKGVIVATPEGRGAVLAKVVIDSTGNADIAAAAGAECVYTDGSGVAVQGAGLPPRKIGARYTNTDWTFIDDADIIDTWRAFVVAKKKFKGAYDLGQLIDTRERRRIVGDFIMSPMDISNDRTYPDTVVIAKSDFDSHGFTIHPAFLLKPPGRKDIIVNVPYRCLLPKSLDGILVTGLGVSAHRDAMPVIRMQADIQNQGYAAGVAAAMAARAGKNIRDINIKALQKHLIEKGNLPEKVLTYKDSFPLSREKITQAVERVVNDFEGLEIVLAQPQDAMPLLRKAYKTADSKKAKLAYAHILGMLGDATGADTLMEAVRTRELDKGWNYTGMGQYGASISPLDSLIVALGRTRDKRGLRPILEKLRQLDVKSEFSHCRAVAMALETLDDAAAAKSLVELLKKPGIMGHAFTEIKDARRRTPRGSEDTLTRNRSLRELILARALYRCGDYEGLGEKILKQYARDLRGHYARHAQAILKGKK